MHDPLSADSRRLLLLARMHGVQRSYWSIFGDRVTATPDALMATLRALAVPVEAFADVEEAILERQRDYWSRLCEPVHVSWDGQATRILLRTPAPLADQRLRCEISSPETMAYSWDVSPRDLPQQRELRLDGELYTAAWLPLPGNLTVGYHDLHLEIGDRAAHGLLIAAPATISADEGVADWGVFMPLYALHSERSQGIGDLTDLENLLRWVASLGGRSVGTLPLLPVFLSPHHQASPYSAASRLFWNELFIDPTAAPELGESPQAQALLESNESLERIKEWNHSDLVAYPEVASLRYRILESLANTFFSKHGRAAERHARYREFAEETPELAAYAAFRAAMESAGGPWPTWPERLQRGNIPPDHGSAQARRVASYAQWLAHEQMARVASTAEDLDTALYLDLPVGVPYDSYDIWRERDLFAAASTGAPPDTFFIGGQDWGFPPLHPDILRERGYRYLIDSLRHHLRFAQRLRIDHIMGCHRLFFIPPGFQATEGVYVRYRAEEVFAVLNLEAHRHGALIVGEDLGTVPELVRRAMGRHGLHRMFTLQTELTESWDRALPDPPRQSVASLNTHDMPPFAAFLEASDIDDLEELGHLDHDRAEQERNGRGARVRALIHFLHTRGLLEDGEPDAGSLLRASLRWLAASPASSVIVSLEDLWGETRPQNVPGTTTERPNWQRRSRMSLEAMKADPRVVELLQQMEDIRAGQRSGDSGEGEQATTEDRI